MPEAATLASPSPKASAPAPPALAATPAEPKQSPMQRAQASLETMMDGKPEPKTPTKPEPKSNEKELPQKPVKEPLSDKIAAEQQPKEGAPEPSKEAGSGKENPWKLVETYKAKAAKVEKELAEVRNGTTQLPQLQEQLKTYKERAEASDKRAKELADHMQFVDYSKSDEFTKDYAKPYEDACRAAAADLDQLSIETSDGSKRKASMQDLLALCNMPLGQAREQAEAWFGSSADDVMAHRREVQRLYASQQKALDDAKGKGEQRLKEQQAMSEKMREETSGLWQKFHQEALEKYDFLKPKEGDDEHNSKLEKATSFVSSAMSRNPMDPRLSPEDRAKAIKEFVAVRNRAIGYSALKLENDRLKSKLSETEKSLQEFQKSEPTTGRGKSDGKPGQPLNPQEAAAARLEAHYVT